MIFENRMDDKWKKTNQKPRLRRQQEQKKRKHQNILYEINIDSLRRQDKCSTQKNNTRTHSLKRNKNAKKPNMFDRDRNLTYSIIFTFVKLKTKKS